MAALSWPNPFLDQLADEHRRWLSAFDPQYLRNWEKLFNANDEAAMTEARVRGVLQGYGVRVEPNEDLTGADQCPDFKCSVRGCCLSRRYHFYVEVTCISVEKVVKETSLPHPTEKGARNYGSLNDAFWSACKGKARQCGDLDHPALVAVGTFHTSASVLCVDKLRVDMLLTGETKIAWNVDVTTGSQVGDTYLQTELYSAAFLRPDKEEEIGFARSSISGLLLCGLGIEPPKTVGVLHPNPTHPFDASVLPDVEFGQVEIDRQSRQLHVSWPEGNHD